MTEDEARKKWCPMGRHSFTTHRGEASVNRPVELSLCIASACMMWRWDDVFDLESGYCGLAGEGPP
jgi:hypothetical protein